MIKDKKIFIAVLVSSDLLRVTRCIKTCQSQIDHNLDYELCIVINTKDDDFKNEMIQYCELSGINYVITESDGTPSTGKNSVFTVFDKTDCSHLVQIDGDDFLYPTFLKHIERHLTKYPNTDVLGILPCDSIYDFNNGDFHTLDCGLHAGLWGTNYSCWKNWIPFDTDSIFSENCSGNLSRLMLFSRNISNKFFYDPEQLIGEDYKIHFDLLFAHHRDEITYWFSTASDTWVRDTTSFGIQKKESNFKQDGNYVILKNKHYQEKLKEYIEEVNGVWRSGSGAIPIDFAPLYMDVEEKLKYLNKII